MGTCDSENVRIARPEYPMNPLDFYDVIVSIQSITDIIKGWKIKFSQRYLDDKNNMINAKMLKIGIIGNSNKGKSFILSKLSKFQLPSGMSIKTEGLSIKYPDLTEYKNRKIVLLDSAGLETPVLNDNFKKSETDIDYFKDKSREKIATELFLQNYIIHNSDILIVVVGILSYSEQKILNRIKSELQGSKPNNISLYIIHNLMMFTTIDEVEAYIQGTLLKSATFKLEKQEIINSSKEEQKGVYYYEKINDMQIFHLIFANDYSDAGKYYNDFTLSVLESSYGLKIINSQRFDIVQTVKDRFKLVAKDIFEDLQGEIEFENTENLIKLKMVGNKSLSLKQIFINEIGLQNMINGYEPGYDYYKTDKEIVVKIEAPGKCEIKSDINSISGFLVIKITGSKEKENQNYPCGGRKFGKFTLEIPIKQENFWLKNQQPKITKEDGIFTISYEIQDPNFGGTYSIQKNHDNQIYQNQI
jgi:HSP20 family molecular chaperone IbpA